MRKEILGCNWSWNKRFMEQTWPEHLSPNRAYLVDMQSKTKGIDFSSKPLIYFLALSEQSKSYRSFCIIQLNVFLPSMFSVLVLCLLDINWNTEFCPLLVLLLYIYFFNVIIFCMVFRTTLILNSTSSVINIKIFSPILSGFLLLSYQWSFLFYFRETDF